VPQPVGSDLHVNVPLTNVSVAYLQSLDTFIADRVFPVVPSDARSNSYWKYKKGEWNRTVAEERAPATESVGTGWTVESDTFNIRVFAVHKDIADQDRSAADNVFNLDRDATILVMRDLMLRRELSWLATYFSPSVWSNTDQVGVTSGVGADEFLRWDETASSPIVDIRARVRAMAEQTGYKPNVLVLGPYVFDALLDNPSIIQRIQYTQAGFVTEDLLARAFGVERVLVPEVIQNIAAEGSANDIGFVYGKAALLAYAAPAPSILAPSAGYTFVWTGYLGAAARGQRIKKFRMEPIASDRIEGEMAYDMKLVSADLGQFFTDVVS